MVTKLIIVIVMGLGGAVSGVVQSAISLTSSQSLTSESQSSDAEPASTQQVAEHQGATALNSISYDWQALLPDWTIDFSQESSGPYGMTFTRDKRIEIYVRPDQDAGHLVHVIAHELGHAVDVTLNSGDDRRTWQQARGITDTDWWPDSGARDFSTGAGDFAESFASWQLSDDIFRSTLADEPTAGQLQLMSRLAAND